MYHNPHMQFELARARQQELIREADRRRLAKLACEGRPSLVARIRSLVGERLARQPVVRPAYRTRSVG